MKITTTLILWTQALVIGALFIILGPKYPVVPRYPEYVHKTIYLDVTFDDTEEEIIQEAAEEWRQATDGRVDYAIERLPEKHIDTVNSIIMFKQSEYSPEVLELDERDGDITLAYYNHTQRYYYIAMVTDRITIDNYKAIVMHEFGHSLGLDHTNGPTLMNAHVDKGASYITGNDLYHFCDLHHCQFWKLHDQKEPAHL